MTRTLILPGLHDSDPGHWQSRWEARDDTLFRVIQDDWETPHCADWIAKLDQALALTGPDTVLVAHSAGCALVAHWAVGEFSTHVHGALLVAPSDPETLSFPSGPTGFAPVPLLRLQFRTKTCPASFLPRLAILAGRNRSPFYRNSSKLTFQIKPSGRVPTPLILGDGTEKWIESNT